MLNMMIINHNLENIKEHSTWRCEDREKWAWLNIGGRSLNWYDVLNHNLTISNYIYLDEYIHIYVYEYTYSFGKCSSRYFFFLFSFFFCYVLYLGQNAECSPGGSISDSSETLLQRGSGGRSIYKVLVKGEFNTMKHSFYKRVFC